MRLEIKEIDDNGQVTEYKANGSIKELVWDGFLLAQIADEHWDDMDTCNAIVVKLKGESPIEFPADNNYRHFTIDGKQF